MAPVCRKKRDYASTTHVAQWLGKLLDGSQRGACDIGSGSPMTLGALSGWIAEVPGASRLLDLCPLPEMQGETSIAPHLWRLRKG